MMRAAILLECDRCGGRWCWPEFKTWQRGEADARLAAAIIGGPPGAVEDACPTCNPEAVAAITGIDLVTQEARARGSIRLDDRRVGR